MSIPLTINGAVFQYPENNDEAWGVDATGWAQAVTNGMLQMAGGSFPLTADVNFGGSFGPVALYYKSRSANIATAGVVRLSSTDAIEWRNAANTGNNILTTSGDVLLYNGASVVTPALTNTHIFVGNVSNQPADVAMSGDMTIANTGITTIKPNLTLTSLKSNSANTAASGFLRMANSVDGAAWRNTANTGDYSLTVNGADQLQFANFGMPIISGPFNSATVAIWSAPTVLGYAGLTSSAVTTTELGYLSGTTSSVQTQLGGKLSLTGGTMSGAINMGSNKITGITSVNDTFIGFGHNYLLNGDMRFDQRKEGGTYSSSNHMAQHSLDQWRYEGTGTPEYTIKRDNNTFPAGFTSTLRMQVTTGGTAGALDGYNLEYPAAPDMQENWQWGSAGAVTVTLSFWVYCNQTGTYSIALLNGVDSQSYVSTYTINSANTWEYKTVTVPGPVTGGTSAWPITGIVYGLKVVWDFGSGTGIATSSLNTWLSGTFWKATGSANVISTTSNNWQLTGVQLEIGSAASAFEFIPYGLMLARLQRYYWKSFLQGTAAAQGTTPTGAGALQYIAQNSAIKANGYHLVFPTPMFQTPALTGFSPGSATSKWWNFNLTTDSGDFQTSSISANSALLINSQVGGDLIQQGLGIQVTANARLGDI